MMTIDECYDSITPVYVAWLSYISKSLFQFVILYGVGQAPLKRVWFFCKMGSVVAVENGIGEKRKRNEK